MIGTAVNSASVNVAGALPLAMLGEDEAACVTKVKGGAELRKHLSDLGLVEGAEVKVISRVDGDVIVSVKGARLALNRTMASHVMVSLSVQLLAVRRSPLGEAVECERGAAPAHKEGVVSGEARGGKQKGNRWQLSRM